MPDLAKLFALAADAQLRTDFRKGVEDLKTLIADIKAIAADLASLKSA